MKLSLRLFAVWLVPLLSLSGLASSRQNDFYGTVPFVGDVYSDQADYGADYPYRRAPSHDFDPGYNSSAPREEPDWTYDEYRRDPYAPLNRDPYPEQSSNRGYSSPHSRIDRAAGYGWEDRNRQQIYGSRGYGYQNHDAFGKGPRSEPARQYGFRGEVPRERGGWGWASRRPEYRFRPLTEQERRRLGAEIGWRPRAFRPDEGQRRYTDPLPSEEAYGYRPDSWLRGYDGVGR